MSAPTVIEVVDTAKPSAGQANGSVVDKYTPFDNVADVSSSSESDILTGPNGEQYPTEKELKTLRRTFGHIPWLIYTIALIEMCERFAYYGTTAVFTNFIQQELPDGYGGTGAAGTHGQPGALGLGQRAATAISLTNSFWSYFMPLLGGYMADAHWGRFKTIGWGIVIAVFGHIVLVISAIPAVIKHPDASVAVFVVGLLFFGTGVGFFKCNISPLIAEQYEAQHPRPTIAVLNSGERVILDPHLTIARIYARYYLLINVGALVGQISMVYAEKYVGFWLSFLLPTIVFFFCPAVMIACRNRYVRRPPTGSVLSKAMKLLSFALGKSKSPRSPAFWDNVKPSNVSPKPVWMTFDDAWVDEVRRGLKACAVFCFFPVYWLSYNQVSNNMVSQAATMKLDGVPNDVVNNLNPLAIIIFIPVTDKLIYPALARAGWRFTPIKKITTGFACSTIAMVAAAIIQHFIYELGPCGNQANSCDEHAPISVWVQTPAYVLLAISEIFASITGLEYAFTKAPKNMRSLVTGVFWMMNAFSAALAQAFVGFAADPLLVWLYTAVAAISFLGGIGFWVVFRKLDEEEDALNALPESTYTGTRNDKIDIEKMTEEREKHDRLREVQGLK